MANGIQLGTIFLVRLSSSLRLIPVIVTEIYDFNDKIFTGYPLFPYRMYAHLSCHLEDCDSYL